jgi:uncharacterized protein
MSLDLATVAVIDSDTHIVEPKDLWTSRVAKKWGDLVPHVSYNPEAQQDHWYFGPRAMFPCGLIAHAGWKDFAPDHPARYEEFDPATTDPYARLKKMDEYGIHAQVLYPNIGIFAATEYLGVEADPQFALDCVRAYNDFLVDWVSADPARYVPIMTLPIWDLDETGREMERCLAAGHKGIVIPSRTEHFNLPTIGSPHWDPMWAQAQELDLSINFHVGSGKLAPCGDAANGTHANFAFTSAMVLNGNAYAIGAMIMDGVCHRFPELKIVSVESGIGWIPYFLESLDWQWLNSGVHLEHPEWNLLPSEYFRRQIFGCFWFEVGTGPTAIELIGAENFMFETDFPHPTSLSPGPGSVADAPLAHFERVYGDLPAETQRKILHDTAARIYHLA